MENDSLIGKRFIWKQRLFRIVQIIDEVHVLAEDEDSALFSFNVRAQSGNLLLSNVSFDLEREGVYAQWLLPIDETLLELDLKPLAVGTVGRPMLTMLVDMHTCTIQGISIEYR